MKRLLTLSLLVFIASSLLVTSCKNNNDDGNNNDKVNFGTPPSATIITGKVEVITENEVRYHVIISPDAYTVTIVESKTGAVMVDVGPPSFLEATFGHELKSYADSIGKPISVIITHAHVDHFGNIDKFASSKIYAGSEIADIFVADAGFAALYSGNIIKVASSVSIEGLTFSFDKISNAETGENGYVFLEKEKAFFAEDLIYNKAHNFIREYTPLTEPDELTNWIEGLNKLKTQFSEYKHVFVGHNGTSKNIVSLIDENIAYLTVSQELIRWTKELSTGGFATTSTQIVDELKILYPDYVAAGLNFSLPGAFGPEDPGAIWFE